MMSYILGLIIFIGSVLGAIQIIVSFLNWYNGRGRTQCEYFHVETGARCQEKAAKSSMYCHHHQYVLDDMRSQNDWSTECKVEGCPNLAPTAEIGVCCNHADTYVVD